MKPGTIIKLPNGKEGHVAALRRGHVDQRGVEYTGSIGVLDESNAAARAKEAER